MVTDGSELARFIGQKADELHLNRVDVLNFVNDKMNVRLLQFFPFFLISFQTADEFRL